MAKRIYFEGNNFIIAEDLDLSDDKINLASNVYFEKNGTLFIFYKLSNDSIVESIDFSDILDSEGGAYVTIDVFANILSISTGSGINFDESFRQKVVMGLIPGYSWIDKFGKNPDVSSGSVPEDMWEGEGLYLWGNDLGETLYFSSSNALDTQVFEFYCLTLDSLGNWNKEVFEQALAGQTKTALNPPSGDPIVRIHRMESMADSGDDLIGILRAYSDTTVTIGVPDDLTKTRSVVVDGANQTKQLTFTIPTGFVGFLVKGEAGVTKSSGTDECDFAYKSRRAGKVFKEKKDFGVMTSGNNFYQEKRSFPDPIPAKTDLTIEVVNVSGQNMGAWGTFDIMLVDENYLSGGFLNAIAQERRAFP